MIRYQETATGSIKVYLDKRYVGSIVKVGFSAQAPMWHYQPKGRGTVPGNACYSIAAVKRTLETPEPTIVERELKEEAKYHD